MEKGNKEEVSAGEEEWERERDGKIKVESGQENGNGKIDY